MSDREIVRRVFALADQVEERLAKRVQRSLERFRSARPHQNHVEPKVRR